jgi:hypothetical protein
VARSCCAFSGRGNVNVVVVPSAEANRRGDLALLGQSDVLDEQREHPLALTIGRLRIAPHGGEVGGEGENATPFVVVDGEPIGVALTFVLVSSFIESPQLRVPIGFERVRDEPVLRVHAHITLASKVDLVLCSFDLPVPQAIGFVDAGLYLLLDGERHLERHRCNRLDEETGDGGVDRATHDALAERVCEEAATSHADIGGDSLVTP